jgi:hypothetical protein
MAEDEASARAVNYRQGDTPVTLPGLVIVGVKLIGLYLVVRTISQAIAMPFYFSEFAATSFRLAVGALLPLLLDVAIGVILIWKADWIASHMRVPAVDMLPVSPNEHFQAVAFSIVGLILIVWALAEVASVLATFLENQGLQNAGSVVHAMGLGMLIHPLVLVALGLYLFLRGPGLASLWHRMRYGGVRVREVE